MYKVPEQTKGNAHAAEEHVVLLTGNATPESHDKNHKSKEHGNNERTSQVAFQLPNNLQSRDSNMGLNNNKELSTRNSDDVTTSTNV